MTNQVSFNDFRDAMGRFLNDMSDLYNHIFLMTYYENMQPEEIALATSRPLFFVKAVVAHLAELGETIQNDLDAISKEGD